MAHRSRNHPHRSSQAETDDSDVDQEPSKSELKREALALQKLAVAISELPASRRAAIDMPEDLREAIEAFNRMTAHGSKKRQRQYLGKLLRSLDPAPLQQAVDAFAAGRAADADKLHKVERWRDRLIQDDDALTEWLNEHPGSDVQHLRSLIRAARKENAGTDAEQRQPKSYRELFRFLKPYLETAE